MASHRLRPDKVRKRRKVLFDSSFLIAVMEHPTPWEKDLLERVGGFEGVIILPIYAELVSLADRAERESGFARLALQLVDMGRIVLENAGVGRPDDELVSYALSHDALVATVDEALIEQLEAARVGVIRLRGGRVRLEAAVA